MSTYRNLISLCAAAVFALGLGACGSGGNGGGMPDLTLDGVQMGETVAAGTHTVSDDLADAFSEDDAALLGREFAEGAMVTAGGLDFTCSAGPCSVVLNDDGTVTTTGTIMVAEAMAGPVEPPAPAEPTELETAQKAASDAADAAKTASGNADTAAKNAMTAVANIATMQTGEMAGAQAAKAQEYADAAMDAYTAAKAAAADAADATTTTAAVVAKIAAEEAQADAEAAATKAGEYGGMAAETAMGELMISGTMKSVGGTTIDADAPASEVTSGTGANRKTVITGLIEGVGPSVTGPQTLGNAAEAVNSAASPAVTAFTAPVANAASRPLTLGKTVDSADDTARLRIVTKYAGTQTVKVAAIDQDGTNDVTTTTNQIQVEGAATADNAADDVFSELKDAGTYYIAGTDATLNVADTIADGTNAGDEIANNAEPKDVFSYTDVGVDGSLGTADDVIRYVVLQQTLTPAGGKPTHTYRRVDIHIAVDMNDDQDDTDPGDISEVTAKLPVAKPYSHIHFGVWASLGTATSAGAQKLADLGIGFLQSIGDGMTADMPNNGSGTYAGSWVASVQDSHPSGDGRIREMSNTASMTADFRKGEVEGTLTDLATFKADIDGSSFSTDEVDVTGSSLDASAKWTGGLSGGFYGDDAIESGGVFSFATKDNEGGAFTGAFGTVRTDE